MVSLQRLLIVSLVVLPTLLLAGCGGPGGNEGNEGADMSGASSTPAAPPPGRPQGVGSGPQGTRPAGTQGGQ